MTMTRPSRSVFFLCVALLGCKLDVQSPDPVFQVHVWVYGAGPGSGHVTATDIGMTCQFIAGVYRFANAFDFPNNVCNKGFDDAGGGGSFLLNAEPEPGSILAGWSGDCTGMLCRLSFRQGEKPSFHATVRFELAPPVTVPVVVVLTDSFDIGDEWQTRFSSSGAASALAEGQGSGGDPGAYRRMQHQITGVGNLTVFHRYTGGSYRPSVNGAIASLTYSEHRILFDPPFPGAGVASGFALEQGGRIYTLSFGGYTNTAWQRLLRTGITPSDFSPAPGPDFSASGSEIFFGYSRSNSNTSSGTQRIQHGIDNWRVDIVRQ